MATPEEIKAVEDEEAARVAEEVARAEATARLSKDDKTKDEDLIKSIVEERVQKELDTKLASIKAKLDASYKSRDEALVKIADFETKEREAHMKRLEEEGKHKEVYELKLAEQQAKVEALEKRNTELSRDVAVRDALKGYNFRNDTATEMAYREVVAQLTRNDKGIWIHRSGISVKDFVEAFAKGEEQSFLFKPKSSSGAGTKDDDGKPPSTKTKPKSLFDLSQAEVLKLAEEGKLRSTSNQ